MNLLIHFLGDTSKTLSFADTKISTATDTHLEKLAASQLEPQLQSQLPTHKEKIKITIYQSGLPFSSNY